MSVKDLREGMKADNNPKRKRENYGAKLNIFNVKRHIIADYQVRLKLQAVQRFTYQRNMAPTHSTILS